MASIKPEQLRSGSYSISGSFSGSFYGDGSNLNNLPIDIDSLVTTSSFNSFTSSYYVDSGSFSTRVTNLSSSFEIFSGSYNTSSFTGSFIGDLTGTASYALTSSYVENAQTASYVLQAVSSSYALTASYVNTLNQDILITGSLTVLQNATIYGSSSLVYVTASQLALSSSFISLNVFEPVQRFGGLKVYDSGSSLATASIVWDSLHNHWVYQNVDGATYSGGMLLSGPRNTGPLGDEPTLTKWFIPRSDGGDHLNDSQIFSSGSIHQITGSLDITGLSSSPLLRVGTNNLVVTGSKVGIGTSTPRTIFHVVGNYGGGVDDLIPQMLFQNSNTSPSTNKIAIIRTTVGTGYFDGGYPEIWLEAQQNAGNFGFTKIRTVSNHPMLFLTNDIERARINETGNVGINTQSPAGKLHVKTTTNQNIIFTSGTTGAQIRSLVDGNVAYSGLEFDTLSFNFKTNGSDRIFINSTGDIGIGKTTPNSRLDISGSVIITVSLTSQPITLTATSGTASINCTQGNFFNLTLSSSSTIHLSSSNIQPGQTINLRITQPATSGSLTYGSQFKFAGGIPYSASATGSVVDIVSFISFDSITLYGSAIKNLS